MNPKFIEELKIDKYNLDKMLIEQPQKYMEWALKVCEATKEKDLARKDLDLARAQKEEQIRRKPEKYTKNKLTEGIIKTYVAMSKKVQKYNLIYLEAAHKERVLSKIEKAFSDRKKSLEGLVQLDLRLHFSEPQISQQVRDNKEKDAINTRSQIKRRLKKSM